MSKVVTTLTLPYSTTNKLATTTLVLVEGPQHVTEVTYNKETPANTLNGSPNMLLSPQSVNMPK
jgi:hypothetical protein